MLGDVPSDDLEATYYADITTATPPVLAPAEERQESGDGSQLVRRRETARAFEVRMGLGFRHVRRNGIGQRLRDEPSRRTVGAQASAPPVPAR